MEKCNKCKTELMNVYVRGRRIFERLESRVYCPKCDKVFTLSFLSKLKCGEMINGR